MRMWGLLLFILVTKGGFKAFGGSWIVFLLLLAFLFGRKWGRTIMNVRCDVHKGAETRFCYEFNETHVGVSKHADHTLSAQA